MAGFSQEKRSYWERILRDLLRPIPVEDILTMSWAIEAMRDDREAAARRGHEMPGVSDDHKIDGRFFVPPWWIDAVIREKLSLGPTAPMARHLNLKSWNGVTKLLNKYRRLSNIESVMDFSSSGVLAAMPRILWPQYDWQLGTQNMFRIGRAWHVYATDEGKSAFAGKYGIELELFLKVSFGIYLGSAEHPAVRSTYLAPLGVTKAQLHRVRTIIGGTFAGQQTWVQSTENPDLPRDFLRSVTKERPLFEVADTNGRAYLVPSRSNLMLRITDGLYYDIVSDDNARRQSGQAFEELCLSLTKHYIGADSSVEPERQTTYGMSADILVEHNESSTGIILECKIRRIPQRVLTSADPFKDFADDFDDVIKGIVQIWRTYSELYSTSSRDMVGIVLQYDPWTIMGIKFVSQLFKSAHDKANSLSIPPSDRIPVALVGYSDFEILLKNYSYPDIFEAIRDWDTEKFHGWELNSVLKTNGKVKQPSPEFDYVSLVKKITVPWWGEGNED